jgi:hypothetical protein
LASTRSDDNGTGIADDRFALPDQVQQAEHEARFDQVLEEPSASGPIRTRRVARSADIQNIAWVAAALDIGLSTAYRLAEGGQLPGAFKVGGQWRISVPKFLREVHGEAS